MPAALESFLELEKQGKTDSEILSALQEKGFSPQEINDALNQSKIKKAVVSPEGMQPSIMQQTAEQEQAEIPVPVPIKKKRAQQAAQAPQAVYSPATVAQTAQYEYPAAAEQPQTPYEYGYGYTYQPAQSVQGVDVETIEEISEEIVSEKMAEFRNKIEDIADFKQVVNSRLSDFDERLKRIETNIDRLQAALIGRVQEYSQNIKDLGGEMRAVEGAFSKILNPLVDNIKELSSITEKMKSKETKSKEK